jgi:hypothetical protein
MSQFKTGDKVIYSYEHKLNRRSSFINTKEGIIIRAKKQKKKFLSDWSPNIVWAVQINGNKSLSFIEESKLQLIK